MHGDGSIPTAFVSLIADRQALLLATQPRSVGAALPAGRGLLGSCLLSQLTPRAAGKLCGTSWGTEAFVGCRWMSHLMRVVKCKPLHSFGTASGKARAAMVAPERSQPRWGACAVLHLIR